MTVAAHSIIDLSTPEDSPSLWCACECGWSSGPWDDELFAAEAYADHKLAAWIVRHAERDASSNTPPDQSPTDTYVPDHFCDPGCDHVWPETTS